LAPAALSASAQDNVRVTVAAAGGDGSPIRDLRKTDFAVQDAGKPRTIDTFVSPLTLGTVPQLGSNKYSNAPDTTQSGAILVVIDTILTRYSEERNMREMVLRFMGSAAQAKHAVALAILNDKGLHIYHSFQSSSDVLLAGLIKAGLGGLKGVTPPPGVSDGGGQL
jgi:hypothetical protein